MKLQTQIPLTPSENQIDYQSQLLILGSCFAENIGEKFDYFNFRQLQNPLGILFHPIGIENLISKAILNETYTESDIFFLNERWHCFDAHSDLSNPSKENLLKKLNTAINRTRLELSKATHIVFTFGTAWVYKHLKTNVLVANCHKVPQHSFSKELLTVDEIKKSLMNTIQNIQTSTKNVQFVFTISPVRHLKDGFVENQRSKAHLITAIQSLLSSQKASKNMSYFPSYEIVMDELRDYRFFKVDMVHPNQVAIDYIWEKFVQVWLSPKTSNVMKKVDEVKKGIQHKPFNLASEQHQKFVKSLDNKIKYLQEEYSFMKFDKI